MAGGSTWKGLYTLFVALSLLSTLCAADAVNDLQTKGRPNIDAAIASSTTCTKDKVKVRKEWYVQQRKVATDILISILGATSLLPKRKLISLLSYVRLPRRSVVQLY